MEQLTGRETLICSKTNQLPGIAQQLIARSSHCRVWLFYGLLGAGKTTLIQEIGAQLGIQERITSPTFSLVNEYQNTEGTIFYHFDLYRIQNREEVLDIGIEEYIDSGHYCWIEWPEKIESLLYPPYIRIKIETIDNLKRLIDWTKYE